MVPRALKISAAACKRAAARLERLVSRAEPLLASTAADPHTYLSASGLFITVALAYTGGLQGTGDTKSPLYISIVSQLLWPIGMCAIIQASRRLNPGDIWLAIFLGHVTRCVLSIVRFRQGEWRHIEVDIELAR